MAIMDARKRNNNGQLQSGLTPRRKQVLRVLVEAQKPLSAYEIVDLYNQAADNPIYAMSVYRILEYLKSVHLIAHLHSVNKFLAQEDDAKAPDNSVCLYVTCQQCCGVQKLALDKNQAKAIQQLISRLGYQLSSHSIEVPGLCEECGSAIYSTVKES